MAIVKFRTKIGEHEFEIEAEQSVVDQKFAEFRELVGLRLPSVRIPKTQPSPAVSGGHPSYTPSVTTVAPVLSEPRLREVFNTTNDGSLRLRVYPSDDGGIYAMLGDAILVLLYGYNEISGLRQVPAVQIAEALRDSGLGNIKRLDRPVKMMQKTNLISKEGKKRGTTYGLTYKGTVKAKQLVEELIRKVMPDGQGALGTGTGVKEGKK